MKNLFNNKRTIRHMALLAGMAAVILTASGACKKDKDSGEGGHGCDVRPDVEAFMAAGQAFGSNPNPSTCEALRTVSLRMFEKLDRCPGAVVTSEMREGIEETRNLNCSEYGD